MADAYSGGAPSREDFMESAEDAWRLQELLDLDEPLDRTGVGYGTAGTGIAKILKPGSWVMTDGIISTDSFTGRAGSWGAGVGFTQGFGGFVPSDPDGDPETQELGGLTMAGFRGEGMRGSNAARNDEGEYIGKAEETVMYDSGQQTLETSTMGIGYVDLLTTFESGTKSGQLYFNYSTISQEPSLALNTSMVEVTDHTIGYYCENPFYYSESESAALRFKFGWDPTLQGGTYTDDPIKNAIDFSFMNVVRKLITIYPKSLATFPRTPPLHIHGRDIATIEGTETAEGNRMPSGTTAEGNRMPSGTTATRYTATMPDPFADTMGGDPFAYDPETGEGQEYV